jgi:hypothetical protein
LGVTLDFGDTPLLGIKRNEMNESRRKSTETRVSGVLPFERADSDIRVTVIVCGHWSPTNECIKVPID